MFAEQGVDLAVCIGRLEGFGAVRLPQETRERESSALNDS